MFRYNNGQFKTTPPATVVFDGYKRNFTDLTREEWESIGYNEAIPVERACFTEYETEWTRGDDLIYRERIITAVEDAAAMKTHLSTKARNERDERLTASDWTQLKDCPLDDTAMVLWQSYRQALRDIPEQPGFPASIDWPEQPAAE